MDLKFPVFSKGTKIIPQPNCCFIYSLESKIFDFFNYESLIYFNRINGETSFDKIVQSTIIDYPNISPEIIRNDLMNLINCLQKRKYLFLNTQKRRNIDFFELGDRILETKIVQADIEITKNCNLRCKYCFNDSISGSQDLKFEKWVKLLDALHLNGLRVIKVSGGEPFLYHEIMDFLKYVTKKFVVSVNTNGYFIDESTAKSLSELNLQTVQVSLDSTSPQIHEFLRGKGTWGKSMQAIKLLHKQRVPLRISTTVTTYNYDQLGDIKKLARKYNAEISFEVLKNVGTATTLSAKYFLNNPESIKKYSEKYSTLKILGELEMTCQAQLGIVGISHKGNIKPCNLTEDFFFNLKANVVEKIEETNSYSNSKVLINTTNASNKVNNLLKMKTIKSKDKCIFEY